MVNKCCVIGCKSLYSNEDPIKARIHRFPLLNPVTLPKWIAATGRVKNWKPGNSSRLCGNHFKNSDYVIGHGKNILKKTAVPTIEYRANVVRNYRNKSLMTKLLNENEKCTKKNDYLNFTNMDNSHDDRDNRDDSSHNDDLKNKHEDFNHELKNDICNRKNQCYMFTSSFKDHVESIVLTSPEESLNSMNTDPETSVPTIEYGVNVLRNYRKKSLNSSEYMEQTNNPLKNKPVDSGDTNIEIIDSAYNNTYNFKYKQQNESVNYDYEHWYQKNENEKCTKKNDYLNFTNMENSHDNRDNRDDSSHNNDLKNKHEDFNHELKNDICNRKNQCYMFTSSFKDNAESIVLTSPGESLNSMNTDPDFNFKKMKAFKLKKQQHIKEKYKNYFNKNDANSFDTFVKAQMKNLLPYRKQYLKAKYKIKKLLMKAQYKIANYT